MSPFLTAVETPAVPEETVCDSPLPAIVVSVGVDVDAGVGVGSGIGVGACECGHWGRSAMPLIAEPAASRVISGWPPSARRTPTLLVKIGTR